jgi:serine/threonine protein kinase
MQPTVGAKVGRFTLMRPIETDDERTVWLGSHDAFGTMELAAIELPPEGDPDPVRATALRREAEVAQHLSHEGIQRVLEVGELEGRVFIAREFVEGVPLSRLQAPLESLRSTDDPSRLASIAHLVGGILDVLAHTHAVKTVPNLAGGVIHGQLTAHDVLVSTHGKIKIAGFGLDRRPDDGTAGMMSHAALRCMPAEQLHRPELTPALDIYSVGILLHTLLDGQPPWPGLGGVDLYRAILSGTSPEIEHPSPAELAALRSALVAPIGQRISSAEAAAQMLRRWPSPKPDVSADIGQLVRRTLAPTPTQEPFDLASQTSSELRPMSVPPSALATPPMLGNASAPGPIPGTPATPGSGGAPGQGPAYVATPSGPAAPPSDPAFVSPSAPLPGPTSASAPAGSAARSSASPGPAFASPPPAAPPAQATLGSGSLAAPGTHGHTPGHAVPPSATPAATGVVPPAEADGTAMIDPEMLARMREEARRVSRADPGSSPSGGGTAPLPPGAAAPPPSPMPPPASARPAATSGVVGNASAPAQPGFVGSTGTAHQPASVVVNAPSTAPKRALQPPPSVSASPVPKQPMPNPTAPVFEPSPDIGEGTTTAMLVRRERRSLTLILVGGALVSILLGVVVAYLVFL